MNDQAEQIRTALVAAALRAYEEAGHCGLCAEGRWEAAVSALRSLDLASVLLNAPSSLPAPPETPRG